MGRVRQRDTAPELEVQRNLKKLGRRFQTNGRQLPGSPDIVYYRQKVAVFVHGCFWHRHDGCKKTTTPKSRQIFWQEKFAANKLRDARNVRKLRKMGWHVFTVWECKVGADWKPPKRLVDFICA